MPEGIRGVESLIPFDRDLSPGERWTTLRKADLMEEVFVCEVKVDGAEGMAPTKSFQQVSW